MRLIAFDETFCKTRTFPMQKTAFYCAGVRGTFFVIVFFFFVYFFFTFSVRRNNILHKQKTEAYSKQIVIKSFQLETLKVSIGHQLSVSVAAATFVMCDSGVFLQLFFDNNLNVSNISLAIYSRTYTRKNTIQIMTSASLHFISAFFSCTFSMHNFRCCCAVWVFHFKKRAKKHHKIIRRLNV